LHRSVVLARRTRQLALAIAFELGLAGLSAAPALGQASDSALVHLSLAIMYDASTFRQDTVSTRQVGSLPPVGYVRMNRIILSGVVKVQRAWRYLLAVDYNGLSRGATNTFSINDLAIIVPIAGVELAVGRQKEGITEQHMVGSRSLSMTERPAPLTAFVPTRDDGVRLIGGSARHGRWSVGWFNPEIATAGTMAKGANVYAGRVFFAPTDENDGGRLAQVGGSVRWSGAPDAAHRFRSRPEDYEAPDFPDTKSFDAHGATMLGLDVLVQRRSLSVQAEGYLTRVGRPDSASLAFQGYYLEAAWRPRGEARSHDARNGALGRVQLRDQRPAWELAVRASHLDLTSKDVGGGVLDRLSAAASWRTSRSLLLELQYGYGLLDKAGGTGHTQFLTVRTQWELR
jgi:phosphate-selective porin OprO and OprP